MRKDLVIVILRIGPLEDQFMSHHRLYMNPALFLSHLLKQIVFHHIKMSCTLNHDSYLTL